MKYGNYFLVLPRWNCRTKMYLSIECSDAQVIIIIIYNYSPFDTVLIGYILLLNHNDTQMVVVLFSS